MRGRARSVIRVGFLVFLIGFITGPGPQHTSTSVPAEDACNDLCPASAAFRLAASSVSDSSDRPRPSGPAKEPSHDSNSSADDFSLGTAEPHKPRSQPNDGVAARAVARLAAAFAASAALVVAACAGDAAGATSATFTATVPVAVTSITVSPQSGTFAHCTGGSSTASALGFPNGTCTMSSVTVSTSGGPASVDASASNAAAGDGGTGWTLCVPGGTTGTASCANTSTALAAPGVGKLPGANQFALTDSVASATGYIQSTSACLPGLSGWKTSCAALTTSPVSLTLYGPQSATDGSSQFTFTLTFTAVPAS